jgi:hypothetical protein
VPQWLKARFVARQERKHTATARQHDLDVRWSPATENRNRRATEAGNGVTSLYQAAHSEDKEGFLRSMVNFYNLQAFSISNYQFKPNF